MEKLSFLITCGTVITSVGVLYGLYDIKKHIINKDYTAISLASAVTGLNIFTFYLFHEESKRI
jgi:hypothetical protein